MTTAQSRRGRALSSLPHVGQTVPKRPLWDTFRAAGRLTSLGAFADAGVAGFRPLPLPYVGRGRAAFLPRGEGPLRDDSDRPNQRAGGGAEGI